MFSAYIFAVSCLVLINGVNANVVCRNERNQLTDWYVIYKFPKIEEEKHGSTLSHGLGYAYLSSKSKWLLSNKNVSSDDSFLGNTLNGFYNEKKNLAYLIYNDESPETNSGTSVGHTKGIVAFGKHFGFWLIHSIPKFPPEDKFKYPSNALENGQSALCITFKLEQLNQIGKQLLFNHPNIYAKGIQEEIIESLDKDVKSLFTDSPMFVKKAPFIRTAVLRSRKNKLFTSFAKDNQLHEDLYSNLVATELKIPLLVETWRRGSGTPLPPACSTNYTVEDIEQMNITVSDDNSLKYISFFSSEDHSKWAISSNSASKWVCVGDINRMESQKRRGGGTVCFISSQAWGAYMSGISKVSTCKTRKG